MPRLFEAADIKIFTDLTVLKSRTLRIPPVLIEIKVEKFGMLQSDKKSLTSVILKEIIGHSDRDGLKKALRFLVKSEIELCSKVTSYVTVEVSNTGS